MFPKDLKQQFEHLDRMQKRIMAPDSQITWEMFIKEPESCRNEYYQWIRNQCGEFADLI